MPKNIIIFKNDIKQRIIVTPAGRKKFLSILVKYLKRDYELGHFDKWILWINTKNQKDIKYLKQLEKKHDFIFLQEDPAPYGQSLNLRICNFFKYCCSPSSVYLRLDDDIVYIEPGAIKSIFDFRIKNEQYFLVFGNVVNNNIITHLHQRFGAIDIDLGLTAYKCWLEWDGIPAIGWADPLFAEKVHKDFLRQINNVEIFKFNKWILANYERVSINAISWLGREFRRFNGEVGADEEEWLTTVKPRELGKRNIIWGDKLFVHFSFGCQSDYLLKETKLLERYRNLKI